MSDLGFNEPDSGRRIIYISATILFVALLVVALVSYSSGKSNQEAEDKADELIAALENAGVERTPSREQIVGVLGDDGGALCDDPGGALRRSILYGQMMNGAAGPGMRPVIVDNRVVMGQLLAIQIYCPDEIKDFKERVDDLEYDDVIG